MADVGASVLVLVVAGVVLPTAVAYLSVSTLFWLLSLLAAGGPA